VARVTLGRDNQGMEPVGIKSPVAIETSAQREAVARARQEIRRARLQPLLWSTRILVVVVGAPVALLGISAGMRMERQERNTDKIALAALTNRMEQRLIDCIARSDEPLPEEARYQMANAEQASVYCEGICPGAWCALEANEALLHQAPFGFSHTFTLDFTFDRIVALDRVLDVVRPIAQAAGLQVRAAADGQGYALSCPRAPTEPVHTIAATFRERADIDRVRGAIERARARCSNF
jgi:hypothetical protein